MKDAADDDEEVESLLTPNGYGASTCGYCGVGGERSIEESSLSYGMISEQLSPRMYQRLIDRGWRRSGTYIYHPDMSRTCCPQYTIRLNVLEFDPARDKKLRKVLGRWKRWVVDGGRGDDMMKGKSKLKHPTTSTPFSYISELHSPEYQNVNQTTISPPAPAHKYKVSLVPSEPTHERFSLYNRYQMAVHGDAVGKNTLHGFKRFLCDNPLGRQKIPYDGHNVSSVPDHLPKYYGCYHQLHYIDDTLIAFSVLDILPGGVSSVYFVWSPDYAWASLGALSAIREAALAREMVEAGMKDMGWLYMGYYIHSCHKMRYKGDYKPSQLLDPGTNTFHALEKVVSILDANPRGYHPFDSPLPGGQVSVGEPGNSAQSDLVVPTRAKPPPSPTIATSATKKRKIRRRTEWPDEPPPSFADPEVFSDSAIQSILVVLNGDMVLPFSRVPFQNPTYVERIVRELVAAVGIDEFASTNAKEKNLFVTF